LNFYSSFIKSVIYALNPLITCLFTSIFAKWNFIIFPPKLPYMYIVDYDGIKNKISLRVYDPTASNNILGLVN